MATLLPSVSSAPQGPTGQQQLPERFDRERAIEMLLLQVRHLFRAGTHSVCMITVSMLNGDGADDKNRQRLRQLSDEQLKFLSESGSPESNGVA